MITILEVWKKQLSDLKKKAKKCELTKGQELRIMKLEGLVKGYETCDNRIVTGKLPILLSFYY